MIRRRQRILASIHVLLDALAASAALVTAWYLRFVVEIIPVTRGPQDLSVYLRLVPLVAVLFPLIFTLHGIYRQRPGRTAIEELLSVAMGVASSTIVLSGLLLWFRPAGGDYSRATLALFSICSLLFISGGRLIARWLIGRRIRRGEGLERVLVVGGGDLAREVIRRIEDHRGLGLTVVGYVAAAPFEGDPEYLGTPDDVVRLLRSRQIDHVYVAMPHQSAPETMMLLDRLSREYVSVHVVPDLLQYMALRSKVEDLDGLPTVNLSETPLAGWNSLLKRIFDLVTATVASILFAPVMIGIAAAIRLEDGAPVVYRQRRMGLDGQPFEMIKFRSMKNDAEAASGAVWASRDDERRTRVGRFIRRWSLDELPQLINVLRGEMSLVGPRPERPEFVEKFREEFPHYMLRHKVRAGMTGWAQVHGWRGNTSVRMRVEHDLFYIENWSLFLDLKILLMTIRYGFRHENAY
ncbi:MAG: undecaprenyl-phosphate glucose phosphotransferase [Acidobacteria bacterium]|nr:undecaprenyl-phosphate glucose phosphotransferase [Acidobacteriota bacterium]